MRQKIFVSPEFSKIRVLVTIALLSSLITLFYNSVLFSLQLSFAQNFLLPLICVSLFLSQNDHLSLKEKLIASLKLSIFIGGVVAAFFLLVGQVNFFFLGGRETAAKILGQSVSPLTLKLILVGLQSQVFLWFLLVLLSSVAGIIAGFISMSRKSMRQIRSK